MIRSHSEVKLTALATAVVVAVYKTQACWCQCGSGPLSIELCPVAIFFFFFLETSYLNCYHKQPYVNMYWSKVNCQKRWLMELGVQDQGSSVESSPGKLIFFFGETARFIVFFSVLQIIGKPFFLYISSGLVKARNGAESNSCGRFCFHVILGDLTTCVLNLCRKVWSCTFWNRWDVYFQMSRQQVRFPDYGKSNVKVKILKCASMSLTTLIITCLGHFILYGEEKSPDIEMIFLKHFRGMCFAFSMVSQSTASCFLASARSSYTLGLAHLASTRKQDLDWHIQF